jgi:hypothetical protein
LPFQLSAVALHDHAGAVLRARGLQSAFMMDAGCLERYRKARRRIEEQRVREM